jgi:alkylation response protein AidB-like acyl-CoA dehydrogenase
VVKHSTSYNQLKERYDALFTEIGRGELAREAGRHLPLIPLRQLQEQGFGAITVPVAHGGAGAQHQAVLRLLMDLAAVDANLAHMWRSHLAFVEYIHRIPEASVRDQWWERIVDGAWGGSALSSQHTTAPEHETAISADSSNRLRITGKKYYTTGTLAADWTVVSARLDEPTAAAVLRRRRRGGESGLTLEDVSKCRAIIRVRQPRVRVKDDWDGFGQRMTATGTLQMHNAGVELLLEHELEHPEISLLNEASLAALLAGVGRAALRDGVEHMRHRTRVFNTSNGEVPRNDDQMLGVIGELSAQQAAAEELVRVIGREFDEGNVKPAALAAQRASVLVPKFVLDICTRIFDTLGASSTSTSWELDRHWRNARTLASHDPAIFKARNLGDWEVNRAKPKLFVASS